jgi:hypothetical protein
MTQGKVERIVEQVERKQKRDYVSQSDVPKITLDEALKLAEALRDGFALKPTAPHQLAIAVSISPTSSKWQDLCGASIAYGLTEGGYNAKAIAISALGRRIVSPIQENDDRAARAEAALRPRVAKEFFGKYDRNKFPQERIAKNVLQHEMAVPASRVDDTLGILLSNGNAVGFILETKTGPFVAIENYGQEGEAPLQPQDGNGEPMTQSTPTQSVNGIGSQHGTGTPLTPFPVGNGRVFIAHGKEKEIVEQLKKLLTFGSYEPVVAEEHETTARPVPQKVIESMRSCVAGILHLGTEEILIDKDGNEVHRLNENVLIEIGAAMALYGRNFILLVERGVGIPSNCQGLYCCYYEGDKLDMDATMRLLQAFRDFEKGN